MIPILYKADEKDFTTQGLGLLSDVQSVKVTEQRNAQYYLNVEVPVFSKLFKELKLERLIKVDDHNDENQLFRIKKIDTPSHGICSVYAEHISRDIEGYTINPDITILGTAEQALSIWQKNLLEKDKVSVHSNIMTVMASKRWTIDNMENPFFCLGGKEGSILQLYKGEYRFDNLNIHLLKERGYNTGASVTYGRNMNDLSQEETIEELANSIYPFAWKEQEENQAEDERGMIVLDPLYVDGPHIDKYSERRVMFVDFTDKAPKDKVALKKLAEKYVKDNNIGSPKVSMTVSPVLNGQIAKGLELEKFEQVNLCDVVTVKYHKLGIDVQAKVNEVTFDVLSQRFSEYKLGDEKRTLASSLGAIESNISNVDKELKDLSGWAQQSADGKNTIFYGRDEPKANKVGDTWFKENPDGSTTIHVWNGQTWKEVKTDYTDEFEQLDKELAEQKENIDKSLEQSEQAIKDSNLSIEKAEKAEQDANKAIEDAGFVGKGLEEVKNTVDYQSNKITELDETTVSNGKQIEEIGTGLKETITKTDENGKQITQINKDYDGLSTIVTDLEKDFENLELPARNLVRDSLVEECNSNYPFKEFETVEEWDKNSEYGLLLKGDIPDGAGIVFYGNKVSGQTIGILSKIGDGLYYYYGKPHESLTDFKNVLKVYITPNGIGKSCVDWVAVYKNDSKTKSWYPALEDNAKTLSKHWTAIEQNTKNINMQAGQIKNGAEKLAQLEIDSGKIQSSVSELEQRKTGIQNLIYKSRGDSTEGATAWFNTIIEKISVFNDVAIRVRTPDDSPIMKSVGIQTKNYFKVKKDEKLQVSFDLAGYYGPVDMSYMHLMYKDGRGNQFFSMDKFESVGTHLERVYGTVTPSRDGEVRLLIGTTKSAVASSRGFYVARWQIVKSDIKITDWSPAPEDMSGKMSVVEQTVDGIKQTVQNKADKSEVTQLAGQITSIVEDVEGNKSQTTQNKELILQTIEDVDGRFVSTQQSIDGIQQTVKGKADQSQVTQLDNQITQTVEDVKKNSQGVSDNKTQITQNKNMINMKVSKGDVVGQLNIEAGKTLIENKKVVIDAETVIIKGKSWMDGAVIKDATIGTAQIKNASITSAKIGSIDASKVTTGTLKGVYINMSKIMSIEEGGFIQSLYDYGDASYDARWYTGGMKVGNRVITYTADIFEYVNGKKGDKKYYSESYFGGDTFKLRRYAHSGQVGGTPEYHMDATSTYLRMGSGWNSDISLDGTSGTVYSRKLECIDGVFKQDLRVNGENGLLAGRINAPKGVYDTLRINYERDLGRMLFGKDGSGRYVLSDTIYNRKYGQGDGRVVITSSGTLGTSSNLFFGTTFDKANHKSMTSLASNAIKLEPFVKAERSGSNISYSAKEIEELGLSDLCYKDKNGNPTDMNPDKFIVIQMELIKELRERCSKLENIINYGYEPQLKLVASM